MKQHSIHIFRRRSHTILFDTNGLNIYSGNICNENQIRAFLQNKECNDNVIYEMPIKEAKKTLRKIHRITVCVSNDCNLRCKYCYAHGGNYDKERNLMSANTAKDFVTFCCENYDVIDSILFFGGEPFLNYKIIKYICDLFQSQSMNKKLKSPKFAVITNGTIFNKEIQSLIRCYISQITISIDGDKYINDKNRVFINGTGSFTRIKEFIDAVKQISSVNIRYEATYTSEHIKSKISRYDVKMFMKKQFGLDGDVMEENSLDRKYAYNNLCQLSKAQMLESDFECLPQDFWQVLYTLVSKNPHHFCGLLKDRVTVSSKGNVVACQMLMSNDINIIGNINENQIQCKIEDNIRDYKANKLCMDCWCEKLCGGCVLQKFYVSKENTLGNTPNNEACAFTQAYLEEIMSIICTLRSDKATWSLLIKKAIEKFTNTI